MAVDMFLKIDDIKGESQDNTHKNEVEVLSWHWGMTQSGSSHSGTGSGTGKVSVQDLSVVKHVDYATPNFIKMCCNGKHFKTALLTVRKAGGEALEYYKLTLSDGLIASVTTGEVDHNGRLIETISLNFASFSMEYAVQGVGGLKDGTTPAKWNIAKNSES
jgi:type VI secretion system secreted protein Hcp